MHFVYLIKQLSFALALNRKRIEIKLRRATLARAYYSETTTIVCVASQDSENKPAAAYTM